MSRAVVEWSRRSEIRKPAGEIRRLVVGRPTSAPFPLRLVLPHRESWPNPEVLSENLAGVSAHHPPDTWTPVIQRPSELSAEVWAIQWERDFTRIPTRCDAAEIWLGAVVSFRLHGGPIFRYPEIM